MAGVNKAILLGHLGRDPEMRYLQDGKAVATLNLATSENFKDRDGNKQERTEWHRVVFFGRPAEIAGEYLRKGSMAYVEGKLQTRKWTDREGVDRYTTEIVGDRLQLVGGKPNDDRREETRGNGGNRSNGTGGNRNQSAPRQSPPPPADEYFDGDDDIPF